MPEANGAQTALQAAKRRLTGKHKNAYIYGTMRKAGWKPKK